MANYEVKPGHPWDSKEEFEKYRKHLMPKLKKMLMAGFSVNWNNCDNWVKLTKYLGRRRWKNEDNIMLVLEVIIKVFRLKSTYGIENGRISKMEIVVRPDYPNTDYNRKNKQRYYHFDRGLDYDLLKRKELKFSKEVNEAYNLVIELFN